MKPRTALQSSKSTDGCCGSQAKWSQSSEFSKPFLLPHLLQAGFVWPHRVSWQSSQLILNTLRKIINIYDFFVILLLRRRCSMHPISCQPQVALDTPGPDACYVMILMIHNQSSSLILTGGLQEVRGPPGPRLQRRPQADRQAVLHQQRLPLIQEVGVKRVSRKRCGEVRNGLEVMIIFEVDLLPKPLYVVSVLIHSQTHTMIPCHIFLFNI